MIVRQDRPTCILVALALFLFFGAAGCKDDQPTTSNPSSSENNNPNSPPNSPNSPNSPNNHDDDRTREGCESHSDCRGGEVCREGLCYKACDEDNPCPENLICIERTCQDEPALSCNPGSTRCAGNNLETCNPEGDGWDSAPCEAETSCQEANDTAFCGASRCEPNEIGCLDETTAFACNGDGSMMTPSPCPANRTCEEGLCVAPEPTCQDACEAGARTCTGDDTYALCNARDAEGCLEWSTDTACGPTETCENGSCVATCEDQCVLDGMRCNNSNAEICARQNDGCTAWTVAETCQDNERCDAGTCVPQGQTCQDECNEAGNQECYLLLGYRRCGNFDDDECLEWGDVVECSAGFSCTDGACQQTCEDQCEENATRCDGDTVQTCGNINDDLCMEWEPGIACPTNQTCQDGACVFEGCTNECRVEGQERCEDNQESVCGDFDDDECLEWGPARTCRDGYACHGGECIQDCSTDTPCRRGQVIFTEIQYNPAEVTDRNGEYIEIHNVTDQDFNLEGCTLGDDGNALTLTNLPLPARGYLVFSNNGTFGTNGGVTVDYTYGNAINLRNTGGEELILSCNNRYLDKFAYPGGGTAGSSLQLTPSHYDESYNDELFHWCESTSTYGDGDRGTPGAANTPCFGTVHFYDDLNAPPFGSPLWTRGSEEQAECNWSWAYSDALSGPCALRSGGCLGTNPGDSYWQRMDPDTNYVQLGPLDLSNVSPDADLVLTFEMHLQLPHHDSDTDSTWVEVSRDGTNFARLPMENPDYHSDNAWTETTYWVSPEGSLASYIGDPSLYIRWVMETDNVYLAPGVTLDNVFVRER